MVGADEASTGAGYVEILFLRRGWSADAATNRSASSLVIASARLADGVNGVSAGAFAPLRTGERFGAALASMNDMDGDGVPELAVAARIDRTIGNGAGTRVQGCVFLLYLRADGSVREQTLLHEASSPALEAANPEMFGGALARVADLDGNGQDELAVGCTIGAVSKGAIVILYLRGALSGAGTTPTPSLLVTATATIVTRLQISARC